MLDLIYQKIGAALVTVAVAIFGIQVPADMLDMTLGATNQIPDTVAVFETSLQNSISSTDSAMTLVAATYNNGASTLASSTYAFVIDGGSSSEEFVTADCTATACTNMTRGLDHLTGTSTVSALRKAHRRGASVKIVTGPTLLIHNRLLQGIDGFKTALRYDTSLATSTIDDSRDNLVNVGLLQDTVINAAGILGASETASGIVEIATQVEAASSTSSGTLGRLALPASMATSTYNSGSAALRIPITQNNGKIDPNFIDFNLSGQQLTVGTTTINGSLTLAGGNSTSNIASSSISAFTASTSPTTTWTKPSNLKYILVKVVGAGGGGGAKQNSGTNDSAGGGGGAGGYCEKIIPADALSATVNVVVPAGGAGGTGAGGDGATNAVPASFGSFCTATNGNAGQGGASEGSGGTAGVGSGGDINLTGGGGSGSGGSTNMSGGAGGNSVMGGGGAGTDGDGNTSGACGGGGGGGGGSSGSDQPGGAGAAGCVYVYQYFF